MTWLVTVALLGLTSAPDGGFFLPASKSCYRGWVTGYIRGDFGPRARTYDVTLLAAGEPIAAAGWNIPIGTRVEVVGVGTFRVADRGYLGPGEIDVAVWTRARAYEITGWKTVCLLTSRDP